MDDAIPHLGCSLHTHLAALRSPSPCAFLPAHCPYSTHPVREQNGLGTLSAVDCLQNKDQVPR
jgi:hypothetical protein